MSSSISAAPKACVRRDEMIPREIFRPGDRIRAYIYDVRREPRGPQIFLSRTHPQFMARLFAQEVPEIYDGIIEIRAVARDPGSRAKIAVISQRQLDRSGRRLRRHARRARAGGGAGAAGREDRHHPWSPTPATFIVNALAPAEVTKVVLDEEPHRVEVVVPDDQLSLAIGRRGQNVRLASQLTGWQIDILTEAGGIRAPPEGIRRAHAALHGSARRGRDVAQLLASEGFATIEDVAYVPTRRTGRDRGLRRGHRERAAEPRARQLYRADEAEFDAKRRELGVDDEVAAVEGLTTADAGALGENGIKTMEDLAGCASDDLLGYVESKGNETGSRARRARRLRSHHAKTSTRIIMKARVKAGWIEAEDLGAAGR